MLPHHPAHSLRNANSTLADNDNRKQTHALHQMRLLEAENAPKARYCDHRDGFQDHYDVPHDIDQSFAMVFFNAEGGCHACERGHTDCIDGEHEDERQVDLRVFGFPCEVQHDEILDGEKTPTYDKRVAEDSEILNKSAY